VITWWNEYVDMKEESELIADDEEEDNPESKSF
jgi:hypothetical protein